MWENVGYSRNAIRTGVAGLLPLHHLGPLSFRQEPELAFRGTFDYTLDAKNRLTVPARFRAALSEGVVLAVGVTRQWRSTVRASGKL